MSVTEKISFADLHKSIQAEKHNSDLSNLAHALEFISAGRIELNNKFNELMKEMSETEVEINALATKIESGSVVDVENVSKLYYKARKVSSVNL